MPKILVTGGAGYIGSNTTQLLRRRGFEVVVLDDLSRGHVHNVADVPFHVITLSDTAALTSLLKSGNFDAVIHFAAYISVGESTQKPELYFANNVGGTISLLTAMMEARVTKLVFSSTAAVYGMPEIVPIPETSKIAPLSPYGESKVMVETILRWMDQFRELRSVVLRYFNACGADPESPLGEEHDPETHLIPLLFRAIETGKAITLFGNDYNTPDGTCIRDYIHVVDLAEAHIAAVQSLLDGGGSNAFNVGTGAGHSVLEVVQAVERVTGRKVPFQFGPRREGDPATLVANSSKLQGALHWQPRFTELDRIVETAWDFAQRQAAHRAGIPEKIS
jgi:UDP-glucose-4-epimerase GalE